MLNVITLNVGNYQGRGVEYTNILHDSVRRNLPEGFEGRFIVFTDEPHGYNAGIEVKQVGEFALNGWWNKLALFADGLFADGDRIVYLDLSAIITGRLDALMEYRGDFAILRDFYRPDGLQSSVMAWEANTMEHIWRSYLQAGCPMVDPGGDQIWIERTELESATRLQEVLPEMFASYKVSGMRVPAKASVVVFHGSPKPHQAGGWVDLIWKIGGMCRSELDAVCNTNKESILANVRSACSHDLPWFEFDYSRNSNSVCIVGGGPSLRNTIERVRMRKQAGDIVWSCNGTHDYLVNNGIVPDAHFMVDAREMNVEFVRNPIQGVKYYIASMCHPSVFDALQGHDVTVFHCNTEGAYELLKDEKEKPVYLLGAGSTVGMRALMMADLMGYRDISLFGMDACVTDSHHAYVQPQNDDDVIIDAVYGDKSFRCAPWMIGQAEDFIAFASRFSGKLSVAGDGFLAHIASEGIDESAADSRAREILDRIKVENPQGAEIGVFAADLSERLLNRPDLSLLMVDSWVGQHPEAYTDSDDYHANLSQQQQDAFYEMSRNRVTFANGRANILRLPSVEAAKLVPDESLDFVFIDADHSYEGCSSDIQAWLPKLKADGILAGHDYDNSEYPKWGVKHAVDEFCNATGYPVELGDNFTWFVRLGTNPSKETQ